MATKNLNPGDLYFENMFNDATRNLEGGLWHNTMPVGSQGTGTDGRYIKDLQLVQTGLSADVAAGDFSGDQLTHVNPGARGHHDRHRQRAGSGEQ
jgi:trimeric autotransporter adhesin